MTKPKYLLLLVLVSLMILAFAAWLPNLHLISSVMTNSTMSLWQKTNLLASLLGSLQTNFTALSRLVTIVTAVLAGLQISLATYYLRQTAKLQRSMGVSLIGIVSSMFGIGCASCGSVILTSLIGLGSTTAILGFLPFRGQEFGFIGIAILLYATNLTIKKINQPFVCKVERTS